MTLQYDGRRFYDDAEQLWYGASIEHNDVWAYIEIKGMTPSHACERLRQLIGSEVKINYMEAL